MKWNLVNNRGWISIDGSNFSHISSWGSIINDSEYVGFNTSSFAFSYFDSVYQRSFSMRYPLNKNSIGWETSLNWVLVNIQNSVFSDWQHEFRSMQMCLIDFIDTRSNYDYYIYSELNGLIFLQQNGIFFFVKLPSTNQ